MSIIKKPVITEKATALNEDGVYVFVVDKKANKIQIKKAVEETYNVTVDKVRTINYQGKSKSRYTKTNVISGRTPSMKKAVVKLAEGEIIDFYEGI